MALAINRTEPRTGLPPVLTDGEFRRIADIARASYGIQLESHKKTMIQSRLSKRLRRLNLAGFAEYCALLESGDAEERQQFVTSITTNVTHFFREAHHFDQLMTELLPPLIARAAAGGRVRLWSAGCSSGPEAYSLASCVTALCPDAARYDIRILATDLDPVVLVQAEAAAYDPDQCATPDPKWARQVFERSRGDDPPRIRPEVRNLVTFRQLNLNDTWPMPGLFDVIMCRNVAIYFDRDVQARLWPRFAAKLLPGGTLFIGHSERLSGPAMADFEPSGITAYRKRP